MFVIAVVILDIVAQSRCYKEVVRAGFITVVALLQTVLTGTGGVGRWWVGGVDDREREGGGKRWMKCIGNEEIKIGNEENRINRGKSGKGVCCKKSVSSTENLFSRNLCQ